MFTIVNSYYTRRPSLAREVRDTLECCKKGDTFVIPAHRTFSYAPNTPAMTAFVESRKMGAVCSTKRHFPNYGDTFVTVDHKD